MATDSLHSQSPLMAQAKEHFKDAPDLYLELENFLPGIGDSDYIPSASIAPPPEKAARKSASTAPKRRKEPVSSAPLPVKRTNPTAPANARVGSNHSFVLLSG